VRNRLLLVMVGVVALLLAVHDIPLAGHLEGVERDRLVTGLERDAFIMAGRAEEALEAGTTSDDPVLRSMVARYEREEDVRVVIVAADGIGAVGSDPDVRDQDFTNRPEIIDALSGAPSTGERFSKTLGEELFFVAVPVLSGEHVVGAVRLTAPERVVSDRAADKVRGLFLVAAISLLITIAVAWLFARGVTRPLSRLQRATDQLAAGDLGTRADDADGPPEIRSLAGSFNSMAGRLGQLVDRQRAFAGTASHQLRTPLTALRLRLEQLSEQVDRDTAAAETVEAALLETDRLHRMIEGLLALSRAEDAAVGPVHVDLSVVARERAEHWMPLAEERSVEIAVDVPDGVEVLAIGGAVEQIIDNLIDNALEVSPTESTLQLRVVALEHTAQLHVIDEGPGMSAGDRAMALDRFWRGEEAAQGGSGLGLAIAHQLAAAGDGSVELLAAQSGGIDALVRFRTAGAG
jgi:signal transduction histidine kinase